MLDCKSKLIIISIIFLSILCFSSCSSSGNLVGKWQTVAISQNNTPMNVMESDIEFAVIDRKVKAIGFAGVNLFRCEIDISGNRFKAFDMENTGFRGILPNMQYEDLFFTILMNTDSYKIENDYLYLYSDNEKSVLCLKKIIEDN